MDLLTRLAQASVDLPLTAHLALLLTAFAALQGGLWMRARRRALEADRSRAELDRLLFDAWRAGRVDGAKLRTATSPQAIHEERVRRSVAWVESHRPDWADLARRSTQTSGGGKAAQPPELRDLLETRARRDDHLTLRPAAPAERSLIDGLVEGELDRLQGEMLRPRSPGYSRGRERDGRRTDRSTRREERRRGRS